MFRKIFATLFLLHNVLNIEGLPEFRQDYTYIEAAEGWLKLHLIPATWSDARIMCHAEGAVLASPLTKQLLEALVNYTQTVPFIFTGVHATYAKGVYTSIEGVPLDKLAISWAGGEPNNLDNSESCLALKTKEYVMWDVNCNHVFPFVCYKKKTENWQEKHLVCGTRDEEYKYFKSTGKCYKFHVRRLDWPRAYLTCVAEGGHLAVVNSNTEFEVLKQLFARTAEMSNFSNDNIYAALGFSDPNDGTSWITIHGETLKEAGFERWQDGEPNNASQPVGELCGVMYRGNGNFYDAPCYWSLAFICEKTP